MNVATFVSNVATFVSNIATFVSIITTFVSNVATFRCNVTTFGCNVTTFQSDLLFHVLTLSPTLQRSREVFFCGVPETINQDFLFFYKNFISVENSLHLALLLPKACTKISMLFLLCHSNLEPLNIATQIKIKTSKIKPSKLKTKKMMNKMI